MWSKLKTSLSSAAPVQSPTPGDPVLVGGGQTGGSSVLPSAPPVLTEKFRKKRNKKKSQEWARKGRTAISQRGRRPDIPLAIAPVYRDKVAKTWKVRTPVERE